MAKTTKPEPAEALLTRTPDATYEVVSDGFTATLYKPDEDAFPGKALIMVGGSDGYYSLTKLICEQFVARGLTTLALRYWNGPGLPEAMAGIPLEYAQRAAAELHRRGYEKVGMWGISMGSEYALLSGEKFPNLISCVVAVCPADVNNQALDQSRRQLGEGSCFTLGGENLPWCPLVWSTRRVLADMIREGSLCMRSCYVHLPEAPEESRIKVENIAGPVLVLSPKHDTMWPSEECSVRMMERLDAHDFPYPHECIFYDPASHLLVPYDLNSLKYFRAERKHPEECRANRMRSLEDTLAFLRDRW